MSERITRIRTGFQPEVVKCMGENKDELVETVKDQLYSGIDGRGAVLSPSYSSDPWFQSHRAGFFDEDRQMFVSCYQRPELYVEWKERITPPRASDRLGITARDIDTPNLFINGFFYSTIDASPTAQGVQIFTAGWDEGADIERKYGSEIFAISEPGAGHFNRNFLWQWLRNWIDSL